MYDDTSETGSESASGGGVLFSCKGIVTSPLINGEAEITVSKDNVAMSSLFDATRLSWADVTQLQFVDYTVYIRTKTGAYIISKLGQMGELLYNHLLSAYGDKVRKCLFAKGGPMIKAAGDVFASELSAQALRGVPVEVHENSVLSLPPDLTARRTPLCFVTGFSDKDFSITITTLDGKQTVYSKLGYEHTPVSKAIQDNIRALREKLTGQIIDIDPTLNGGEASLLANLMPGGLAAPMEQIKKISPSFAAALEKNIAESRAADTYKVFKEISGADAVCIGFKPEWDFTADPDTDAATDNKETNAVSNATDDATSSWDAEGAAADGDEAPQSVSDENPGYMLWLAAPSPSGDACAIEFAGAENEAAATFVYKFERSWDAFRIKLGMALEAIDWKREVIRLTDEELGKPEYELYRMANDRNDALSFVRSSFIGRGIHRSLESWKTQIFGFLNI
jgi:hypothetical protein